LRRGGGRCESRVNWNGGLFRVHYFNISAGLQMEPMLIGITADFICTPVERPYHNQFYFHRWFVKKPAVMTYHCPISKKGFLRYKIRPNSHMNIL
jgi:hypothetical protein